MRTRPIGAHAAGALLLAVAVTACGTATDEAGEPSPDPGTPAPTTSTSTSPPSPTSEPTTVTPTSPDTGATGTEGPSSDPQVQAAIDDLAADVQVEPGQIEVVTYESVTWSDGSLGCPQPGQMYSQALVDGHRLVLATGGEEYAYHSGGDQPLTRCTNPQQPLRTDQTS